MATSLLSLSTLSLPTLSTHLSWAQVAFAFFVITAAAAVQGAIGFGAGLLASPLLVLVDPVMVPGPMLVAALVLICLMIARERQAVDMRGLGWAMLGRVPGTAIAIAMMAAMPADGLVITVGALVVAGAVMSARGLHVDATRANLVVAGLLSGIMSTTASIGGPPMALVYQHAAAARLRATLAGHFLAGCLVSLIGLYASGQLGAAELQAACVLAPGMAAGFVLSTRFLRRVDDGWLRPAVLVVSALSGLVAIVRGLI